MIRSAFNAEEIYYQPRLPWIEGAPEPEEGDKKEDSIQPDVIYKGKDGTWNIVEFKLPLLDSQKLTTGRHARRDFIKPVRVGISQLANYVDYFTFQANREAAAAVLSEEVTDPKPTLVVGNYENVDMTPISEAMRATMNFEIVDYDLLLRLFVQNMQRQLSSLNIAQNCKSCAPPDQAEYHTARCPTWPPTGLGSIVAALDSRLAPLGHGARRANP